MNLEERMKKEIGQLGNQINKLEQEAAEKRRRKKNLEKAMKQLLTVADSQTAN